MVCVRRSRRELIWIFIAFRILHLSQSTLFVYYYMPVATYKQIHMQMDCRHTRIARQHRAAERNKKKNNQNRTRTHDETKVIKNDLTCSLRFVGLNSETRMSETKTCIHRHRCPRRWLYNQHICIPYAYANNGGNEKKKKTFNKSLNWTERVLSKHSRNAQRPQKVTTSNKKKIQFARNCSNETCLIELFTHIFVYSLFVPTSSTSSSATFVPI